LVPDILFELELKERHGHLLKVGLRVKSLTAESVKKIEDLSFKYTRPSMMDRAALALAIQEGCPLLTGDKDLRTAAKSEGVGVHGTVWIIEELLKQKIIEKSQARGSFDSMKVKGSRLPWEDVEKLLVKYN
jgi:predicted nucleic acid-binding protein